ncbi:hypothetical protein [Promicromonospora sp. NPDC023987]|uniref:hypothetical protein n=1 Tax=Promicromonospora sp. NPDC023987 TaxID=3155360 RepID=UPI0033DEA6A9
MAALTESGDQVLSCLQTEHGGLADRIFGELGPQPPTAFHEIPGSVMERSSPP